MRGISCKLPIFYRYCGNSGEDWKYQVGTQKARRCKEKLGAVKVWMPLRIKTCSCEGMAAKVWRQEDQLKNQQLLTVDLCFLDYLGEAQVVVYSCHVLPGLPG
ncbi:hypothetical protein NDU88_000977 [Pleurodeles waltl]|uniref:Uncharacterized protein n=1 Tax=Pleurodeles waltl TaxID=8319 RepID=A0AAV7USZ1_PLEWA|nr:hypothetical protein NDU88_000977 [Pleurodeles waltl]